MGAALVATVHRDQRLVELDPGVRPGARLDGPDERILLHCTSTGTADETARLLASALRRSGWQVRVRDADELDLLAHTNGTGPGMVRAGAVELLARQIDPQHRGPDEQPVPGPPRGGHVHRWVCTTCFHVTNTVGRESHARNIGHHDFVEMTRGDAVAYSERMRAQVPPRSSLELPQELAGGASSASDQQVRMDTHLG